MSLGSALFEEMVFDNGQPINATFLEYMPPSMEDHPRQFQSVIVETPHPEGPFGAKGVGGSGVGARGASHRQCDCQCVERLTNQGSTDPARSDFTGGAIGRGREP